MTATPSVRRRILGAALRQYREKLGYSLEDAAHILECDRSKISRIETGQRGIRSLELGILLGEYCVEEQAQETLAIIASPHSIRGWQEASSRSLPDAYVDLIALEMAASHIMVYEAQQVPDLLQCEEYTHALAGASSGLRQWPAIACQIRNGMDPGKVRPKITAVIAEAALRHIPGGAAVARTQLEALLPTGRRLPEARIQVLLSENGAHAARSTGSFTILRYVQLSSLQVVSLRGISGGVFVEDQRQVTEYESAFRQLSKFALTPDASAILIRRMRSELATPSRTHGYER